MSAIVVHTLPGAWGIPSISPFCLKLETYLRMVELPHETVLDATPFQAPKGKLPWIEHEGSKIGDSGFVIDYLKRRFGHDLDAALSPRERAQAHALRRLFEENLYWTVVYDRWWVDQNWKRLREVAFGGVPAPVGALIAPIARRMVWRQLAGHGIGKHSREEIHAIGCRDVNAAADFLGDEPYFMGGEASEIDAVAYGFLANILEAPIETPVKNEASKRPNLAAYCERMRGRYFG